MNKKRKIVGGNSTIYNCGLCVKIKLPLSSPEVIIT